MEGIVSGEKGVDFIGWIRSGWRRLGEFFWEEISESTLLWAVLLKSVIPQHLCQVFILIDNLKIITSGVKIFSHISFNCNSKLNQSSPACVRMSIKFQGWERPFWLKFDQRNSKKLKKNSKKLKKTQRNSNCGFKAV